MLIYTVEKVWVHKQWHLSSPVKRKVELAGFWEEEIVRWVSNNAKPEWIKWGITVEVMKLMMLRWFLIYKYTKGFSSAVALAAAKTSMLQYVSATAAATAVPLLLLAAGLLAIGLFFAWDNWEAGENITIVPSSHVVLMRYEERTWWGVLVGHRGEQEWGFAPCRETGLASFMHTMTSGLGLDKQDSFYIGELWQTLTRTMFGWNVLSWQVLDLTFRGMGHYVGWGRFGMKRPYGTEDPWGVPVGWIVHPHDACEQLDDFGVPP